MLPRPDLTNSNLSNFLVSAFNFLFLVHVKICTTTGNFYHSVRMFAESQLLDKFSYSLEIDANDNKLTQKGSVLHSRVLTLQEPTANCTTIGKLKEFLGDKYNESKFTLRIENVTRICVGCPQKIDAVLNAKFCGECTRKFKRCEFNRKDCDFADFNHKKCGKHEFYFCQYQTKCFRCGVHFVKGAFIEHLSSPSSCSNTIKSDVESVLRLAPNGDNRFNFILFATKDIGTVICSYDLFNSNLYMRLFTALSSLELKDYKCSIELIDPQTKHTVLLRPQIKFNTCDDWFIDEKIYNFPSWKHIGIDVKVNINKM